jgi:parallel beta-helix repeat protein
VIRLKEVVVFSILTGILAISFCALAASVPNPIPDTGQTQSYTDTFGDDSDYTINPQSYTKLDATGNELPDSATSWSMVKDNVTGLIWEMKTDNGSIHDKDNTYTWSDAQSVFIADLNAANFGGFSDWRLPTIEELSFIINDGKYEPAINTTYFRNTMSYDYWSSTTYAYDTGYAWCVYFYNGYVSINNKSSSCYVRAVRGGQSGLLGDLVINGDSTVTDTSTGLMWQQQTAGEMTWEDAIRYCEDLSLGGYNDWRLPNRNELQSLIDYTRYYPAIDTVVFPDTMSFCYWSSTTVASYTDLAWFVHFSGGGVSDGEKWHSHYVRAVRGGAQTSAVIRRVPAEYSTIQAAIDAALPGDTVLVADGIYTGVGNKNLDFYGKAITVKSKIGPDRCIIDCEGSGQGFYFHNGEGRNSMLNGFTMQNGVTWNNNSCYENNCYYGGGVYCVSSSPSINNCIITGNMAECGGGIFCDGSSPTITSCIISGNSTGRVGGGICCYNSSPIITNCTISSNFSINDIGGGIYCGVSSPTISNCIIIGNSANDSGGGICCGDSSPTISNCIIIGNKGNVGGGVYCFYSSSPAITNCILWNDSWEEIYCADASSTPTITYSDIRGGYPGEGNINANPLFVNPAAGDYHLLFSSPCIDSGTNQGAPDHDKDGKTRPMDGDHNGTYICDMGVYEAEGPTLIELDRFTAIPQGNQITINWDILSEIDNAGFNLLRSESENGIYTKINSKIIEAKGGATLNVEYTYNDDITKPEVKYYYKLEDIDTRGNSNMHGPVSAIIPMTKPNESRSTADYYPPYWFDLYSKAAWPPAYNMNYSFRWPYYPYP